MKVDARFQMQVRTTVAQQLVTSTLLHIDEICDPRSNYPVHPTILNASMLNCNSMHNLNKTWLVFTGGVAVLLFWKGINSATPQGKYGAEFIVFMIKGLAIFQK